MPFKLRKAPKRDAYWVINQITGKKYSHEPLSYETAKNQLKALYAQENGYKINLRGGELTPEQIAKQGLLNLRLKYEADKQRDVQRSDGNFIGGYAGTDDTVSGINYDDYKRTFADDLKQFASDFVAGLHTILDKIGLGGVLDAVVSTIGSLGNILGDVFTGSFGNLAKDGNAILVALDEVAKQIPVVNVIDAVGHIVDKAVKGEEIGAGDFADLGSAVTDSITSLASAGTAKGAVNLIKQEAEKAIKNSIKDRLKDASKEAIMKEATRVLFNRYVEQHPELPIYTFYSQLTGNERNVLLDAVQGVDVPEGVESADYPYKDTYQALVNKYALNKNTHDSALLKYIFKNQRSIQQDVFPYTDRRSYQSTQHDRIVDEMVAQDNAKISADVYPAIEEKVKELIDIAPIIKDVAEHPDAYKLGKVLYYKNKFDNTATISVDAYNKLHDVSVYNQYAGKDMYIPVYNTKFINRDGIVSQLEDYNKLVQADKDKLNTLIDTYDAQINSAIQQYISNDNEYIKSAIGDIHDNLKDIVADIVDEILQKVADAGGSITKQQYDALISSGISNATSIVDDYAMSEFHKAFDSNYLSSGTETTPEEKDSIKQSIISHLASLIHDSIYAKLIDTTAFSGKDASVDFNDKKTKLMDAIKNTVFRGQPTITFSTGEVVTPEVYFSKLTSGSISSPYEIIGLLQPYMNALDAMNKQIALSSQKPDLSLYKKSKKDDITKSVNSKYDLILQQNENARNADLTELKKSQDLDYSTALSKWLTTPEGMNAKQLVEKQEQIEFDKQYPPLPTTDYKLEFKSMLPPLFQTDGAISSVVNAIQTYKKYGKTAIMNGAFQTFLNYYSYTLNKPKTQGEVTALYNSFTKDYGSFFNSQKFKDAFSKFVDYTLIYPTGFGEVSPEYQQAKDAFPETYIQQNIRKAFENSMTGKTLLSKQANDTALIQKKYNDLSNIANANRNSELDSSIKAVESQANVPVKSLDDIKRELGILPPPPPPKPVVIPPPVVETPKPKPKPALAPAPAPAKITPALVPPPPTPLPPQSEQQQQYEHALAEIRKYQKERETGVIQDYKPEIVKEIKKYNIEPLVVNKHVHYKRLFNKQPTSSRFGK